MSPQDNLPHRAVFRYRREMERLWAHRSRVNWCLALCGILALAGCRSRAPIYVWRRPQIDSVERQKVVLMGIEGPESIAKPLTQELLAATGRTHGHALARRVAAAPSLILPDQLAQGAPIRLVSASSDGPSDMAVAAAARRQGIRYLLSGQVLMPAGRDDSAEHLRLSWRLTALTPDGVDGGMPIHLSLGELPEKYPQLDAVEDPKERLRQAAVMETCSLLSPWVERQQVTLAGPRWTAGSRAVRRGNRLAAAGRWPEAEAIWVAVTRQHPRQTAAWINAAIAATARQDFSAAKARVSEAVQRSIWSPVHADLARQTLIWIELRQRDFHDSFDLPEPAEGWLVTQPAR